MTVTIPKDVLTELARAAPWDALHFAAAFLPPEVLAELRARFPGS